MLIIIIIIIIIIIPENPVAGRILLGNPAKTSLRVDPLFQKKEGSTKQRAKAATAAQLIILILFSNYS